MAFAEGVFSKIETAMTYQKFFHLCYQENIPLADIRTVLEYVFGFSFSMLGIKGDEEGIDDTYGKEIIQRLKDGYPAVYLSGYDIIRSNKIYLNENVLIPRTETIEFLYDHIKNNYDFNNMRILDLCTGSGFIAIALKSLFPKAIIDASDISPKALALAGKSALENQKDIHFIRSDFLDGIDSVYDVIVSNPPYIEEDSKEVDAPFEPSLALYSGKDGCDSYRRIFASLSSHLSKDGMAFFELEAAYAEKVRTLLDEITVYEYITELIPDMENKPRYLKARRKR